MKRIMCVALLITNVIAFSQNNNGLWKNSIKTSNSKRIRKNNLPLKHLFDLDYTSLKNQLAHSPKRNAANITSNTIISLPNGDGKTEKFRVYENPVMDPALAAKYPEIKSYVAVGIDNPHARAYFSSSPLGFKSMTLYPGKPAVFIEPVTDDLNTYTIYKKSDKEATLDKFECGVVDHATQQIQNTINTSEFARGADDAKLRTFRLALSCTGEYAALFGGTKSNVLAAMNNTLTRINGVYGRDFGVNLILIANNETIVYTDPLTDPYSTKSNWHTELQSNLTSIVGEANYDIGHLLGTSTANSGDAGCVGCVCIDNQKGTGFTCAASYNYTGESFDIDFVAHEMGHQLGATHTFTYQTESGTGSQMEPGSGSTIMSYAGSTGVDVQSSSDSYFHAVSIQQVTDNIKTKTCPAIISTGNAVPIVDAGLDYTIPKGTPFVLTGSATDTNSEDLLTYCWEGKNTGTATTTVPSATATAGPLFRSYAPTANPARYFPNMNSILVGSTTTQGAAIPVEVLPSVARPLYFRLTVRDNHVGGSANNTDDMVITVDGNSGPFTVDTQNTTISYAAGTTQTINWTVAGTNANGVNCANVDILMSKDGGQTWPITLLAATANNGSANVVIPNIPGTTNRIMVKGTNQIFFDVNNANFTITGSGSADTTAPTASIISASGTTTSSTNLSWSAATDNVGVTGYNVYQNGVLKTTTTATTLAVSGLSASTTYSFYVTAKDAAGNVSANSNTVNVTTLTPADTAAPTACSLSASGTTTSSTNLSWTAATDNVGVTGYNVYKNGSLISTTSATSMAVSGLTASTTYSFYVTAKDAAGNVSANSNTVNVTTLTPADTTAPTACSLSASGTTTSSTNLTWGAASDNVGVTGYNVYKNGSLISTTSATSMAVSGLSASAAYSFYVTAKDAAGNVSVNSNTVNVTTLTPADTTAPTASTISASGTTTSSTNLSWSAASDNVGVTGYNVYQNGSLISTTTATSMAVSGLSASTAYSFYVTAKDAAGNVSANSNTVNISTLANPIVAYCSSYGTSTSKEYINKVQIGSISNLSGNNGGYGNFTTLSTNLTIGSSNVITITPYWKGKAVAESYAVWIDFNQDGDFNDAGELVYSLSNSVTKAASGNIIIPGSTLAGTTRMRVSMKNNVVPNPCEVFSYGEVEDYTVNITNGSTAKLSNETEVAAASETVNSVDTPKMSFKLYPNPVKEDMIYIADIDFSPNYRIFNMNGQEVAKGSTDNKSIYVGQLATGNYIIEITDGIVTGTKQFIKQ